MYYSRQKLDKAISFLMGQFRRRASLAWALPLDKYAAVWVHTKHAPHTGAFIPMLWEARLLNCSSSKREPIR